MSYNLEWKEHALRELGNLEKSGVKRIVSKVEEMCENFSSCDVKKMGSFEDHYRLRVGDYRVIFELKDKLVTVLKVGHRQNIYE